MRLFFTLFILSFVLVNEANAQFDSVVVTHRFSYSDWDDEPYGLKMRIESHYDSLGRNFMYTTSDWNGYRFVDESRVLFSYDIFGNYTGYKSQNFQNNSWVDEYRTVNYYTPPSRLDSTVSMSWTSGSWVTSSYTYYSYSSGNHLLIMENNNYRTFYFPDVNNYDTLILQQQQVQGSWTDWEKSVLQNDIVGKKINQANYRFYSGVWNKDDSITYSYYPNDSVFVTKRFDFDSIPRLKSADSLIYSGDTIFNYQGILYNYVDPFVYDNRSVNYFHDQYNFYNSDYEYFDNGSWVRTDYETSEFDSVSNVVSRQSLMTGSESSSDLHFDNDGHLLFGNSDGTSHSGSYSYSHTDYYYYLTNGSAEACPGVTGSLSVVAGMNSYSWNVGGTTNSINAASAGTYFCNLVNQYGHPFQSEPKYVNQMIMPTTSRGADSTILVCTGAYDISLSADYLPVYDYQWFRNDSAILNQNSEILYFNQYNSPPHIEGEYYLVVSNGCGSDTSASTNVHFSQPVVHLNVNGSLWLCPGDTITLTADPGFASYIWITGDTGRIGKVYEGHLNRWVTAYDATGCSSRASVVIYEITQQPYYYPQSIIQVNDSILRTSLSNGMFQWFFNGDTIPNATLTQLTFSQPGFYKYAVDIGGCILYSNEAYYSYSPFRVVFTQGYNSTICQGSSYSFNANWYKLTGGVPPYQYNWSPPTGLSSNSIANPSFVATVDQTYVLTVTDSTGSIARDTVSFHVNPHVPISIEASKNSVCPELFGNDYYVTITLSGRDEEGWVNWYRNGQSFNGPGTDSTKKTYQSGTYWATYINGCYNNSDTIVLSVSDSVPKPHVILESIPSDWCSVDSVKLITDANPLLFNFDWTMYEGSTVRHSTNSFIYAREIGSFVLSITDSLGCSNFDYINENDWSGDSIIPLSLNLPEVLDVCYGDTVQLHATNYSEFNYHWFNYESELSGNAPDFSTIYSGHYKVVGENGFGCHGEDSVYVSFGHTQTDVSLSYNGSTLNAHSNIYVASWQWYFNNGVIGGVNSSVLHPTVRGWYKVIANTNSDCGADADSFFVNCAVSSHVTPVTCSGDCDAIVQVAGSGSAPYVFHWSTGSTATSISNLCSGMYVVGMTDNSGCEATDSVRISDVLPIEMYAVVTQPSCYQLCDGNIHPVISGGSSGYTYLWSGGGVSTDLQNACAGNYSLTVTDAHGCTTDSSFTLLSSAEIIIVDSVVNTTCLACDDGEAMISISGGNPPYDIFWNIGETTEAITGLYPGDYVVCVTDQFGCVVCDSVHVSFEVGIGKLNDADIKVFPNPFDAMTRVLVPEKYFGGTIFLIDNLGEIVFTRSILENEIIFDGANFRSGIYYMEIVNSKGNVARKVLGIVH